MFSPPTSIIIDVGGENVLKEISALRQDEPLKEVSKFRFKATKSKNIDQAIGRSSLGR
jgi:hypothetical protein